LSSPLSQARFQHNNKKEISSLIQSPIYVSEKCSKEGFKLIGSFVSIRRAAKFLGISSNTIRLYVNSGKIFKDRYKFSSAAPK
jgi:hypothetical protein